ncbi:NAD/NADP octopine/nopaline dehydrogenase family protein [Olivibacter domesticus]|uniref:Ketopantoate reductase PanE/ApbA n=1 Tax=Olivibacter domesticus TaxID=407022 RepID=A0A1H7V087_OLID1|nr:NAD/NADP octopine/nopaline dehydrogenase family protein [Olivibacter domesticus]SEM02167.1 Ketopantoate reductase PanE/ApbA [Olivibacter domesticus]
MKPTQRLKVCICGGGGLGHVIAGVLASKGYTVNLLTSKPASWRHTIRVTDDFQKEYKGKLAVISDNPADVIPQSQFILFCLPGFLIQETLEKIKDHINIGTVVGSVVSSTGFLIMAQKILDKHIGLFGFQRVPFIARVAQYGKSAQLLGYKKELKVAFSNVHAEPKIVSVLQEMFDLPIIKLNHILEATLTNSNPLLHPARLYSLFRDYQPGKIYEEEYSFYEEWTDHSSATLIACDEEFQQVLREFPTKIEKIPSLLTYYESYDAQSLTAKIRSISAFKGIKVSMYPQLGGYVPNFNNRYFQEDFPYGIIIVKSIAKHLHVATPQIDEIIEWGQRMMGKEYLVNGRLVGKDIKQSGAISSSELDTVIKQENITID